MRGMRHHGGQRGHGARRLAAGALVLAALGCGERRDAAELAAGVEPFDRLRGINVAPLRSGMVRALRAAAVPAPREGLRETVGAYDVRYAVQGFDGTDGSWPNEEALVLVIEATRTWPDDATASGGWRQAVRGLQAGVGAAPRCLDVRGDGPALRVAEFDRGGGWTVTATWAPAATDGRPARHSVAVRREALTAQLPRDGDPNPAGLPTWAPGSCTTDAAVAADDPNPWARR